MHPAVGAVEQDGAASTSAETRDGAEHDDHGGPVVGGLLRLDRRVHELEVRNAARHGEADLVVLPPQVGDDLLLRRHGALQRRLLHCQRGNAAQVTRRRVCLPLELRRLPLELPREPRRQLGDRRLLQRGHLTGQPSDERGLGRIAHLECPQHRLLLRELSQRPAQLRGPGHRADRRECVDHRSRAGRAGEDAVDRLAIPQQLGAAALDVEQPREPRIRRSREVRGHRTGAVRQLRGGLHAKALQRTFGAPQVRLRPSHLPAKHRVQLGQVGALQIGGDGDNTGRDGVHDRRRPGCVRPVELELDEIAVRVRAHLELPGEPRGGRGWRDQRKGDRLTGVERPGRWHPHEPEPRADRIADGATVEHASRCIPEREGRTPVVHDEPISARAHLLVDRERREHRVARGVVRQVQSFAPHHVIQDDVGPHQVAPACGDRQPAGPERAGLALLSRGSVDPQGGACRVAGGEHHAGEREPDQQAEGGETEDHPAIPLDRDQVTPRVGQPVALCGGRRRSACARGPGHGEWRSLSGDEAASCHQSDLTGQSRYRGAPGRPMRNLPWDSEIAAPGATVWRIVAPVVRNPPQKVEPRATPHGGRPAARVRRPQAYQPSGEGVGRLQQVPRLRPRQICQLATPLAVRWWRSAHDSCVRIAPGSPSLNRA